MKTFCDRTRLPGHPVDYSALREQLDEDVGALLRCVWCRERQSPLRIVQTTEGIALLCMECFGSLQ